MNGASFLRNAAAFFLLRSISYSALSTPNRTVSSAGPPSRSSWSSTVIFCAIPASWLHWGYLHRTRSTVMAAGIRGAASHLNGCTRPAERDQLSTRARPHRAPRVPIAHAAGMRSGHHHGHEKHSHRLPSPAETAQQHGDHLLFAGAQRSGRTGLARPP